MSNPARPGNREYNQIRKFKITPDYLAHPVASVLAECGGTKVICSVTFESGVPSWMRQQNVPGGWVTSEYGMIPPATHSRTQREASKGKQSGRTMEIQRLIGRSFRSVIDLDLLGANTVYIDCDVIDADGGTRCTSICGASVALQMAFRRLVAKHVLVRNPMRENVAAISIGMKDGAYLLDLCYEEDSAADVDFNVIMTESGKFVELQGTAEERPFTPEDLSEMLKLAKHGLDKVFDTQRQVLDAMPQPKPDPSSFGSVAEALADAKPIK